MKLNKIIIAGVALVLAASCSGLNELPKFNPADSFAAFDKAAVAASEDAGRVKIAVTIGSLDPVSTTVTYEVDDSLSTAVAGTHFTLVDPSAVLTFADGARTAYIEVDLLPIHGDAGYTGDKTVVINLLASNGVKIGSNRVCTLTINDQDHPLAAILGEYTMSDGSTVTFTKDPKDVTVIHITDIFAASANWAGAGYGFDMIGQVSADKKSITFALPVDSGYTYSNGNNLMIYAADVDAVHLDDSSITITETATGFANADTGLATYIKSAGYLEWVDPPLTFVKK